VFVIIIGILSSIAIPTLLHQREKAYRADAVNDMGSAAIAIETFSTDHNGDYSGMNGADETTPALRDQGFNSSQ
jgi:Tfp pilus assembly protein PilE